MDDLIEVLWDDAFEHRGDAAWHSRDHVMPDKTSYEVRSVGYFLKYENDKIYLAGDISGDEVARIFVIPQGCIKGFRKLK